MPKLPHQRVALASGATQAEVSRSTTCNTPAATVLHLLLMLLLAESFGIDATVSNLPCREFCMCPDQNNHTHESCSPPLHPEDDPFSWLYTDRH